MSKQSEAKAAQGYAPKFLGTCGNCKYFEADIEEVIVFREVYKTESNLRCTIGNFAVKKTATCNKFEVKV
jgi:hypothetical protein